MNSNFTPNKNDSFMKWTQISLIMLLQFISVEVMIKINQVVVMISSLNQKIIQYVQNAMVESFIKREPRKWLNSKLNKTKFIQNQKDILKQNSL